MKNIRRFSVIVLVFALMFSSVPAYAWDPITHWHINKQVNEDLNIRDWDIYCDNGTGPDMFMFGGNACDYVHSPNEARDKDGQIVYPYRDSPDFAYIMLKIRGLNDSLPKYYASGLGWGGHITADWVAHNEKLFPIPVNLKETRFHLQGEILYDYYTYLTKGPIDTTFKFYPKQIYKALVNYELIRLHEKDIKDGVIDYDDSYLKRTAIDNTMKEWKIKARCKAFAKSVAAIQGDCCLFKSEAIYKAINEGKDPYFYINQFIEDMQEKGADKNITEACRRVNEWAIKQTPRGGIPYEEISKIVHPFTISVNPSLSLFSLFERFPLISSSIEWLFNFSWAQPAWAIDTPNSDDSINVNDIELLNELDDEFYCFWQEVAEQAELIGALDVQEETVFTEDGEEYLVSSMITDEREFEKILRNVIEQHIQNPSSDVNKQLALFYRNFIVDQISDIDKLMDMTPPTISNLSPEEGSFTNDSTPEIYAHLLDLPAGGRGDKDGIGIEEESISFTLNGEGLKFTYNPETGVLVVTLEHILSDGEYEAQIKASDKAGNETEKAWKFTIDIIPPKIDYEVLNKLINIKKETKAEIEIRTNEPTTYLAEAFRVKDKNKGNKGDIVYAYISDELSQDFIFIWNGEDNDGNLVDNGVYTIRITALDRAKNATSFKEKVNVNNEAGGQVQKQQSQFLQNIRGGLSFLYSLFKDNS